MSVGYGGRNKDYKAYHGYYRIGLHICDEVCLSLLSSQHSIIIDALKGGRMGKDGEKSQI